MVLSDMPAKTSVVVRKIEGGRSFVQRMAEMGISAGTQLRVVQGRGPMIVEVKGHRLVLGHGMVDRIRVEKA